MGWLQPGSIRVALAGMKIITRVILAVSVAGLVLLVAFSRHDVATASSRAADASRIAASDGHLLVTTAAASTAAVAKVDIAAVARACGKDFEVVDDADQVGGTLMKGQPSDG